MRNVLIALVLVAPLASHAAPNAAFRGISGELAAADTPWASAAVSPSLTAMELSSSNPTGGMPSALSVQLANDVSTELLDVLVDDALETAVETIPMPTQTMKLPPLALSWLGGLSRPPVLLPEPFSYSILSIGLLGFIISRFRRTP